MVVRLATYTIDESVPGPGAPTAGPTCPLVGLATCTTEHKALRCRGPACIRVEDGRRWSRFASEDGRSGGHDLARQQDEKRLQEQAGRARGAQLRTPNLKH